MAYLIGIEVYILVIAYHKYNACVSISKTLSNHAITPPPPQEKS